MENTKNILALVEWYMEEYGLNEDDAWRCAQFDLYPEQYNADDYDA